MKTFFAALTAGCLLLFTAHISAAEKSDLKAEMQALMGKIQAKLQEGKQTEKDLAEELKQFDTVFAAHKAEKTDEVAQILALKASLYLEIFNAPDKAVELLKQIKTEFPNTEMAKGVDETLAGIAKQAETAVGKPFPPFEEKDLDGKPLSVAGCKGKILLIDFWATWCGPCVGELPNVLKIYEKYHAKGFEVIGISLDKEKQDLADFLKEKKVPWPQYFDGQGWQNKLAKQYSVDSIPATFLLDKEGKIIGKGLRGEALEAAVAKALGQP